VGLEFEQPVLGQIQTDAEGHVLLVVGVTFTIAHMIFGVEHGVVRAQLQPVVELVGGLAIVTAAGVARGNVHDD